MSTPKQPKVLYVEDRNDWILTVKPKLAKLPARVEIATDADEAIEAMSSQHSDDPYALVIVDMELPSAEAGGLDKRRGLELLLQQAVFLLLPYDVPIIVFTAHQTIPNCVECMRSGAFDYIPKLPRENEVGGLDLLLKRSSEILYPTTASNPMELWIQRNLSYLVKEHLGKSVAVIGEVEPKLAKKKKLLMHDGMAYLTGSDKTTLRMSIINDKQLRWHYVRVVEIPQQAHHSYA